LRIDQNALRRLIRAAEGDDDVLDLVAEAITGFADYHRAVVVGETCKLVYGGISRGKAIEADSRRSQEHDRAISKVAMLNRLALERDIELVYDGTVSREQPYRVEIAEAMFVYMRTVVEKRTR
jgi:hypothetical protein